MKHILRIALFFYFLRYFLCFAKVLRYAAPQPPSELISTLGAIARAAPRGLSLPIDVNCDPGWYYRRLTTTLIAEADKFYVVLALPLVYIDSLYTLYEAVWVPTPHATKAALASYELEGPYLAVSDSGDHYIVLSQTDAMACKADIEFCSFSYPAASLTQSPTCMSSLFLKDQRSIAKHCQTKISKDFGGE